MFHYVYRISNIITKKYYYGSRTSSIHPTEDIGIKYFSTFSNKFFKIDQKQNPNHYTYKIVNIFNTRAEATYLEVTLHKKFDVKNNDNFINRANQTSHKFDTTGNKSIARKISESKKGKPTTNGMVTVRDIGTGITHNVTKEEYYKNKGILFNHIKYGIKASNDTKLKNSEAMKKLRAEGKYDFQKGSTMSTEQKQKISNTKTGTKLTDIHKENISKGGMGREVSEETRKKISDAQKGKERNYSDTHIDILKANAKKEVECPHCGKIGKKMIMMRWHFDKCKLKKV